MTFSICGRCEKTGQLGVAIATSSISVGARCPWVQSGIGAVATQNVTLPSIGNDVLAELAAGMSAQAAVDAVLAKDRHADYRQVIAIDHRGRAGVFVGAQMLGINAVAAGDDCIAAGNLLAAAALPEVMVAAFARQAEAALAERLLSAVEAGLHDGGGEQGAVHSCALLVAGDTTWPLVDLRVDWADENPLGGLRRLWQRYQPQMQDYVLRALHPAQAPNYGVPGDE